MNKTCECEPLSILCERGREKTNARDDFGFAFFPPFGNLGVYLVSEFRFDFASIAGKESEKTLCSAVDDVDFVEGNRVDDFFALLYFALWALHEFCLQKGTCVTQV